MRTRWIVGSLLALAAACAVWWLLGTSPVGVGLERSTAELVAPLDAGLWRVLRGGTKYLVMPAAVVACAVVALVSVRRGRPGDAMRCVVVVLLVNLLVQGCKLGLLLPVDAPPQLSGHVGVVAGVGAGVLLTAVGRSATWRVVVAAAVVGTVVLVVLARWHSIAEAVVPIAIAAAVYAGAWAFSPAAGVTGSTNLTA